MSLFVFGSLSQYSDIKFSPIAAIYVAEIRPLANLKSYHAHFRTLLFYYAAR